MFLLHIIADEEDALSGNTTKVIDVWREEEVKVKARKNAWRQS